MAKVEFYSYFCNIFNRTNMQQSVNTAQGTGRYHLLASPACFMAWNVVLKRPDTIRTSNYLYLNPLFTTVAAHLFLQEQLTVYAVIGVLPVLAGCLWRPAKGEYIHYLVYDKNRKL